MTYRFGHEVTIKLPEPDVDFSAPSEDDEFTENYTREDQEAETLRQWDVAGGWVRAPIADHIILNWHTPDGGATYIKRFSPTKARDLGLKLLAAADYTENGDEA